MRRTSDEFEDRGRQRAEEIEQQAAEWLARIDRRDTPEEWAALDAWLKMSPRHRATFLRLSVAWRRADELKKLAPLDGAADPDLLDPSRRNTEAPDAYALPERRGVASPSTDSHGAQNVSSSGVRVTSRVRSFRALTPLRLAASIAVIALTVLGAIGVWHRFEKKSIDTYSTHVGQIDRVVLKDGSTIELNTNSEVRVRYTSHRRHVELTRGEALFQVAKNKEKPFEVVTGSTTVVAVGTAFSVRLHETGGNERVDIVVSEGSIKISTLPRQTYAAGAVATVRKGHVEATMLSEDGIDSKLAWTNGRLMFEGEKLSDVIAEMNRYNHRKLQISDPDLAELRIGGTFEATDPVGFARALEATFGIKSQVVPDSPGDDVIELEGGAP